MKDRRRSTARKTGPTRGLTRREFGLATVAIAVAGGCSPGAPPPPVDLAVYGDCRQYVKIHRKIANHIASRSPKATIVAGDLVDHPKVQEEWEHFHEITKVVRDKAPLICAIGNHDAFPGDEQGALSSAAFIREMKLERTWYDRVIGDFHLFVLDSLAGFREPEQLHWFEKAATASTSKHKFAVFHHPPFLLDWKRMELMPDVRGNLHPLLVKLKFCAAFCGHQHAFYYTRRDGIPYVVTGGGGSALSKLDPALQVEGDLARSFFHYVGVTVAGPRTGGRVYTPDGGEVPELAFPLCEHA
jgi:3',5'-cyclic AMP phosphodiesterase CpdA